MATSHMFMEDGELQKPQHVIESFGRKKGGIEKTLAKYLHQDSRFLAASATRIQNLASESSRSL
jgi:hypothetical protein